MQTPGTFGGIERRSFLWGVIGGVSLAGIAAGCLALLTHWTQEGQTGVTAGDLQVAAISRFVSDVGVSPGQEIGAVVHFGGKWCGGVVEVGLLSADHLGGIRQARRYIVWEDSGQATPAEPQDSSVKKLVAQMHHARGRDCF